jgi:hypothetical protein
VTVSSNGLPERVDELLLAPPVAMVEPSGPCNFASPEMSLEATASHFVEAARGECVAPQAMASQSRRS